MADQLMSDHAGRLFVDQLRESADVKAKAANDPHMLAACVEAARIVAESLHDGGKVLIFGNGGSSMDAGHLAGELMGRFRHEREPLAAVALADATAIVTGIGNDYEYGLVFARQVRGLGRVGDVAIGLTTSGGSANVLRGLAAAREIGVSTIAITGSRPSSIGDHSDVVIRVPSDDTPRIQECYMTIGHTLCELVEASFV